MTTWASVADVLEYTGATVTDAQITAAQGVLDIFATVTPDTTAVISDRDLRLLKQALSYQTVWQANQIDVFTRTDVKSVTQDAASFIPAGQDSLMLAPLAKRCLDRLSWRKPRSLRTRPGRTRTYSTVEEWQAAWLADGDGTNSAWRSA